MKKRYTLFLFLSLIDSLSWGADLLIKNSSNDSCIICLTGFDLEDRVKAMECTKLESKQRVNYNDSRFLKADKLRFGFLEQQYQNNNYQLEEAILTDKEKNKINQNELKNVYSSADEYNLIIDDVLDRSVIVKKDGE